MAPGGRLRVNLKKLLLCWFLFLAQSFLVAGQLQCYSAISGSLIAACTAPQGCELYNVTATSNITCSNICSSTSGCDACLWDGTTCYNLAALPANGTTCSTQVDGSTFSACTAPQGCTLQNGPSGATNGACLTACNLSNGCTACVMDAGFCYNMVPIPTLNCTTAPTTTPSAMPTNEITPPWTR